MLILYPICLFLGGGGVLNKNNKVLEEENL